MVSAAPIVVDGMHHKKRILFFFWGRRGGLSRFTLDLARAVSELDEIEPLISISRSNELFSEFSNFKDIMLPVDTFESAAGSLRLDKLYALRKIVRHEIQRRRIDAAVCLMPHVWSPLVARDFKASGCRYGVVVHDANPHPGDPTAALNRWLLQDVHSADVIITLSQAVAGRLSARGIVDRRKLCTLFHPDFNYGEPLRPRFPRAGEPFRVLSLGRLLEYKALPMLLDALERLKEEGENVSLGVYGEGSLSGLWDRLKALDATVVNAWIPNAQIRDICGKYHALVLSHSEASQSGIVATAHGLGLPVIVTPVGGLTEQVHHLETGIVSEHADPACLARAIKLLAGNEELYNSVASTILNTSDRRSMKRFVMQVAERVCGEARQSAGNEST